MAAAYECLSVAEHPPLLAKRRLRFEWLRGPDTEARRLEGRLLDESVPIAFAKVTAHHAKTGESLTTRSDTGGRFAFEGIAPGLYILVIEGRPGEHEFEETRLAVRVRPEAVRETLTLAQSKWRSTCSGPHLQPLN